MKKILGWVLIVIGIGLVGSAGIFYWAKSQGKVIGFTPSAGFNVTSTGTNASSTAPVPAPDPLTARLTVPAGFKIDVFEKGLDTPRVLIADPAGVVIASLTSAGQVIALPDANQDGKADKRVVLASGLHQPHGLALSCKDSCRLFVADTDAILSFAYNTSTLQLTDRKEIAKLPTGGRHTTRSLLLLPDGRLLVSIGSSCNVCHEDNPLRGSVQVMNQDGSNQKTFAIGLRNAVFLTLDPKQRVWVTEMGRDGLGDDLPPDEINILQEGKYYGWPTCYGFNVHDTEFDKNTYIRNPCMEPLEMPSFIDLPAHVAPLGLAFVPDSWPKAYQGNLLVSYHGSLDRSTPTGNKVVSFAFGADGRPQNPENFVDGFLQGATPSGRPVGMVFGTNGALYLSDDKAGVIYRITPPQK